MTAQHSEHGGRETTAGELHRGETVADDVTAWARVADLWPIGAGRVRITWELADGRREDTDYDAGERFTLLDESHGGYVVTVAGVTSSRTVDHSSHIYETWAAYVSSVDLAWVNGSDSGLCCHTCRAIVIDRGDVGAVSVGTGERCELCTYLAIDAGDLAEHVSLNHRPAAPVHARPCRCALCEPEGAAAETVGAAPVGRFTLTDHGVGRIMAATGETSADVTAAAVAQGWAVETAPFTCAECGTRTAATYVVTTLDYGDPATRTEVCRACDDVLRAEQRPRR